MIRFAALGVFSLLAVEAHALSCVPPNVAQEFNWRQAEDKTYRIFVGNVKMTGRIPRYREGKPRRAKGVATGRFLGTRSLTEVRDVDVTVKAVCAASWCGGFPSGNEDRAQILFLEKTPKGDVLTVGPCDQPYGQRSIKSRIKVLQKCLRQGKCAESDIKRLGFE